MEFTPKERRLIRVALQYLANVTENNALKSQDSWVDGVMFRKGRLLAKRKAADFRELKKRFQERYWSDAE